MQRCLYTCRCPVLHTPLMHHTRRCLSRHLHASLLGQGLGSRRVGRPSEELQTVKAAVPAQQAKVLVPFQLEALRYVDWEPGQREAYLNKLHNTIETFWSVPNGRVSQQRSAPIPMQTRTPGLDQSPRNIDQLFNINTGQQHPVSQSASLSPPPKPQSVTQTTGRASVGASQHEGDESTRLLHLNGLSARHAQSDQPSSSGSSSGSHAPAASALPRSVKLTEAVRDFLAKPVTGPCRPIFFDLETTGPVNSKHRILELAGIGGHSGKTYSTIVNTEGVSSMPGALATHGITDAESWQPSTPIFGEVLSSFLEFVRQECSGPVGGVPVLVAHNGKNFDFKFLNQECKRWGVQLPGDWHWLDSFLLAKECVRDTPGETVSRSLGNLRERFGIPPNQAHRALDDSQVMQDVVSHMLKMNGALTIADVVARKSKCSGTLEDLFGPATKQRAVLEAKRKSTEENTASLIQDEEDAWSSEPDPVSTSGLAAALSSTASRDNLKEVKVNWRRGLVENSKLDRELLDLPPEKVKAMTAKQQKTLKSAGFETFWEVLQYYPKDYLVYQSYLQNGGYVRLQGTVSKSSVGGPYCNIQVMVDPTHNPLLDPKDSLSSAVSASDDTESGAESAPDEEYELLTDDDLSLGDGLNSDLAESTSVSELNEHGRSIVPEEASTSSFSLPYSSASSVGGGKSGNAVPKQLCEQQILEVKQYFGGPYARYGATNMSSANPVGSKVLVQCKASMGATPGTWTTTDAVLAPAPPRSTPLEPQLVARYPARKAIKDKDWPKYIERAVKAVYDNDKLRGYDVLPPDLRDQYDVIGWLQALIGMHRPGDAAELEAAKRRMAFEELLLLQLKLLLRREIDRTPRSEVDLVGTRISKLDMMQAGRDALGFRLTDAQDRVLTEIVGDMEGPAPMMRLLQGDVGSGKTAVAMLALMAAAGSGWQGALMAPTEVLAEQHMMKLEQLVSAMPARHRPRIAILTGSAKAKERKVVYAGLADGSTGIIVGTHALITDALEFKKLGLAVIDEQHRFGVGQRAKLQNKNTPLPHVLSMTATPIPRTLALTAHGDMALSAIDELPPGRQPVQTFAYQDTPSNRKKMYAAIRKELSEGGRTYIICPLVEESSAEIMADVRAAEEEHRRLQQDGVLGGADCGLLHGRMSSEEKIAALQAFATGHTPVLISTTVVEVGVDVPEASVIIVEHSERFGLAQLHQLRGRVGRGSRASTCYLMTPHNSALARLQVLTHSQNGFTIAEADLQERGPGDFLGKKQSGKDGLSYLKAAKLPEDRHLLEQARAAAAEMLLDMGLDPTNWPEDLLAALKDRSLPDLDLAELPQLNWSSQRPVEGDKSAAT